MTGWTPDRIRQAIERATGPRLAPGDPLLREQDARLLARIHNLEPPARGYNGRKTHVAYWRNGGTT